MDCCPASSFFPRRAAGLSVAAAAIEVDELVKTYGQRRAVDGLSLQVQSGEVLAMLGPNGAGKTTTVEILEGYRRPDSGTARVLGLDPWREGQQLKPKIGLMLQQGGVYPTAYPLEMLKLYASFFERPLEPAALLRRVGLEDAARTRCRRLSGGQRQRLLLALALIGQPRVLFMDEPTAAMDPQARQATWELIREQQRAGVTILLTTHNMEEAERLADRVAIVDQGRLIALDAPRRLIEGEALAGRELRFTTRPGLDPAALGTALGGASVRENGAGQYEAEISPGPAEVAALALYLREQGALLTELRLGYRTLEDVFLGLTGRELRH
jgi:ABC-2 type transport system ATP-binding protein